MFSAVSPYALLKGSKPQPAPVCTSDYDLFSAATQDQTDWSRASSSHAASFPDEYYATPPARTHYISDIHARHSRAAKNAKPCGSPTLNQPPPSLQTPST